MRPHLGTLLDDIRANGAQTAVVTHTGNRHAASSYADLASLAARFAAYLEENQITQRDRLILWGDNSAEWLAAFFGCVLRGVLVVPLDAAGSPDFARNVIADTHPRLIVGDAALLASLHPTIPTCILATLASTLPQAGAPTPVSTLTRDTPLQILFTSGTTGDPKGIVHTHGNILASLEPIEREMKKYRRYERLVHPLRFLHTLPLSHVFGQFMGIWLPPVLAAEVHFESRPQVTQLIDTIRTRRINLLIAVPRLLDLLRIHLLSLYPNLPQQLIGVQGKRFWIHWWNFRRIHSLFGFRFWACICGGASLPPDLEAFWNTLGFALIQGYGMTETAALITLNHPFKIGQGTIGKPLPGRDLRIGPDGEVSVRGPMVATSVWHRGALQTRDDPWLATGDMVTQDSSGQLRFIGRKSEVIVTASGVNIHPEDLEAALTHQPGVASAAVVPFDLPSGGQEPVAALVVPSGHPAADRAVIAANRELAGFQQIRRWLLWPDPDLPRTSTGKVQRRRVAARITQQSRSHDHPSGESPAQSDPLLTLIASITSEPIHQATGSARLQEDLHLDSLGRLQLQSALEQRFGISLDDEAFLSVETLGQLRQALGWQSASTTDPTPDAPTTTPETRTPPATRPTEFIYPKWPWSPPIAIIRTIFLELIARPLVWLFANPSAAKSSPLKPQQPMILIANHLTAYDVPLLLYRLPPHIRRHVAIASAGEMLEDWRHARNQPHWWQNLFGPIQYFLLTALFNVFPLPRQAGFRRSFDHIGDALDRGYHVLIFPEGHRSLTGDLQPFRSGIGLLARDSHAPILPLALKGLGDLLRTRPTRTSKSWLHASQIRVIIGQPVTIDPTLTSEEIVQHLHAIMETLLRNAPSPPNP